MPLPTCEISAARPLENADAGLPLLLPVVVDDEPLDELLLPCSPRTASNRACMKWRISDWIWPWLLPEPSLSPSASVPLPVELLALVEDVL